MKIQTAYKNSQNNLYTSLLTAVATIHIEKGVW